MWRRADYGWSRRSTGLAATFDLNDTVTFDPKTDPDVGEFFIRLPDGDYLPTWYQQRINGAKGPQDKAAAEKAAKHANTPVVAHFDALGRPFLGIIDKRASARLPLGVG